MLVSQEQGGTAAPGKGTHISEPGLNCAELSCHPQQLLSLIPTLIYRCPLPRDIPPSKEIQRQLQPQLSPSLPTPKAGGARAPAPAASPKPRTAGKETQGHFCRKIRDKATCSGRACGRSREATAGRGYSVPRAHLGHPSALAGSHLAGSQLLPDGEDTFVRRLLPSHQRGNFGQLSPFLSRFVGG